MEKMKAKREKRAELLAPAGSYPALEAAFRAGADAVYLGGQKFGARAYADNLDTDQMKEAIRYAHIHGRQLYLTVNTLLKNRELEKELYEYLAPYYEEGLDAVIVQDLGVLRFIRREFPGMHIHASTQMTITGVESARLLKDAGASRIVTARELSLKEIQAIYQETGIEIESFIHGALCYCYSGQCLMSSMIGGRSGNRGRCAQPCRLPYQVYRNGKRLNNEKTAYALSPKDMCTVRILSDIIDAGVFSLKIEGRMKKPEYTAGVVQVYRKYLDRVLAGEKNPQVSREDYQMLMDLYNRDGFHESYYKVRNGKDMMALRNEKKTVSGTDIRADRNEELFSQLRNHYLERKKQEKIKGILTLYAGCSAIMEVSCRQYHAVTEGAVVQQASNRPLDEERVRRQIQKTGDTEFVFEQLEIFMGDDIFMPMQQLNELRRNALESLEREMTDPFRRKLPVRSDEYITFIRKEDIPHLYASVRTEDQLKAVLTVGDIAGIYADCGIFSRESFEEQVTEALEVCRREGKELYLMLPHMVRDHELDGRKESFTDLCEKGLRGFLVRNLESFGVLKQSGLADRAVLDANLYTMNGESQLFWDEQGVCRNTVPLELNQKEISYRNNSNSEIMIYGYVPMMISVQCLQKNMDHCDKKCAVLTLEDRYQKKFHAVCSCEFCYNTIYNALPMSLLQDADKVRKLGVSGYRLSFTVESEQETREIAERFAAVYMHDCEVKTEWMTGETTRGHFNRKVE